MNAAESLRLIELDVRAAIRWRAGSMRLMRIDRWDVRRDGPLSDAALRQKISGLGYEPVSRSYPPGTVAAAQCELQECLVAVAQGLVKITIDGESAILAAGDLVFVQRGAVRRIEVVGASPAACLEAACHLS